MHIVRAAVALPLLLAAIPFACAGGFQTLGYLPPDDAGATTDVVTNGHGEAAATVTAASCGAAGEPCCDAGCVDDASFCSANNLCLSARPTDVGSPCTSGATCQSGLCTNVEPFDASGGASPPSPTVCSAPCWKATDCLPGWTCLFPSQGPIVTGTTGPGTCLCAPAGEACDGKDNNCDGVIDEEPGASVACTETLDFPATCVDAGCGCIQTCDGGCVNATSDPNNCGACGHACAPGLQFCANSQCVCDGTLCPIPDGGVGDAGYVIVPDGGPGGSPAVCVNTQSDPNNCGGCGIACAYACAGAGACVPMVLAALPASAAVGIGGTIVSDGTEVLILTALNGGVIEECSITGCNQSPAIIVPATNLDNTNNAGGAGLGLLALGGSRAYWPGQAAVRDVTLTAPTVSVFAQPANASVYAVATNATHVFWSDASLGILSCAIGSTCALPSTLVPIASLPAPPQLVAADDSYVYWADANGDVLSAGVAGGPPVLLQGADAGASSFSAMVASAGRVYFIDSVFETAQLMTATGGAAYSATTYSAGQASALATDGMNLYWGTASGLSKCALGASCAMPTVIYSTSTTSSAYIVSLAVDAKNIYWIDNGSGGSPIAWEYHK